MENISPFICMVIFYTISLLSTTNNMTETTTRQLTSEEISRVFAMYWGQSIIKVNMPEWYGKEPRQINSVTMDSDSFNKFLLALTSLPSITDEHAIELANVALRQSNNIGIDKVVTEDNITTIWHCRKMMRTIFFWDDFFWAEDRNSGMPPVELPYPAYLHLIKLGYAVPLFFGLNHWANGKTAIELGIAIEK